MQPTFPADHHFHNRGAEPRSVRDGTRRAWPAADTAADAERGIAYLSRQVLPAFKPGDPRADPSGSPAPSSAGG